MTGWLSRSLRAMNDSADRSLVTVCRSFSRAAGLIAALAGILVLAGWLFGIDFLKTIVPSGYPMRANAAGCFILCGTALWLIGRESRGAARGIGQACAALAALIGLATLAEYLFGIDLGIDQLLFREAPGPGVAHPGRMPLPAAINFVLLGCALILLDAETRRGRRPAQLLALPAGLIAFLVTFDYVLDLKGSATDMALHGALLFGLLSLGVLLARPEKGVAAVLVSPRLGGVVARRAVLSCVATLVVVGWLRWMGQRVGLYGTEFGVILMVTFAVAMIAVLIWMSARALDRADEEREHAGEVLRQASAYNRSLIEASLDPLVTIDAEGKIGDVNRATELATGFSREELVGKDFCDYFTEPERARAGYRQVFETGQVRDYELMLRHRDGHTTQVLYNAAVYRDQAGEARGVFAVARDITEQKRAAEELQTSERELALRNRIGSIVLILDDEMYNEVLKVILEGLQSRHGVFGHIDEDGALVVPSMTRHIWDRCQVAAKTFTFPRDAWGNSSWPRAIREKRTICSNEASTETPEGHIEIRRHISLPILFQGEVIGLFQVANKESDYTEADIRSLDSIAGHIAPILAARLQRDREERKRQRAAEEVSRLNAELERRVVQRTVELEATNKELEAFTYSVSHDLRAPLRHMDGFARLLNEECSGQLGSPAGHYLDRIQQGSRQMGRLVDDLLDLTRVGRQEVCRQVTGLNSLVEEVLRDLAPEVKDRNIEWRVARLPFVDGDPRLLKQVLMNLISNAIKFTRPREQVVIEIGQAVKDGHTAVYVRDNGIGFSMKYADKLFKVFQRLHRPEDFEGTGVGLATVQRIIHKHGGQVWAEGELDKGATFYFALEAGAADSIENRAAAPAGGAQ